MNDNKNRREQVYKNMNTIIENHDDDLCILLM